MKWPLIALLAALALPAQAIVGGQPTTSFRAVGIGVQVAPDWVLTVRHFTIAPGGTYQNGFGSRTVAEVFAPGDAQFPADDIALLRLAPSATPLPEAVYPRLAAQPLVQGAFRPQSVTIVSAQNHSPRGVGLTRVTEAMNTYDDDGPGPLPPVNVNWLVSWDTNVRLESGDSGGGLFLNHVRDSVGVLLGLNSALIEDENGVPIGSAFVQPAAYRSWIDSVMQADLHDDQQLGWASIAGEVPEPAAWTLLLAGGLLLLRQRRP
jgi:MYXO-CTERM domain-containing protein